MSPVLRSSSSQASTRRPQFKEAEALSLSFHLHIHSLTAHILYFASCFDLIICHTSQDALSIQVCGCCRYFPSSCYGCRPAQTSSVRRSGMGSVVCHYNCEHHQRHARQCDVYDLHDAIHHALLLEYYQFDPCQRHKHANDHLPGMGILDDPEYHCVFNSRLCHQPHNYARFQLDNGAVGGLANDYKQFRDSRCSHVSNNNIINHILHGLGRLELLSDDFISNARAPDIEGHHHQQLLSRLE